jgi:hypothetical protein
VFFWLVFRIASVYLLVQESVHPMVLESEYWLEPLMMLRPVSLIDRGLAKLCRSPV